MWDSLACHYSVVNGAFALITHVHAVRPGCLNGIQPRDKYLLESKERHFSTEMNLSKSPTWALRIRTRIGKLRNRSCCD
jgi:hypothetical protein